MLDWAESTDAPRVLARLLMKHVFGGRHRGGCCSVI